MTEEKPQTTRKKPATRKSVGAGSPRPPRSPRPLTADPATIRQALDELGIDRPYYTAKVVGGRLELRLYGGDYVYWPADPVGAHGGAPSPKEE